MPTTPALGCQIAPHYEHDPLTDEDDSTTEDESESPEREQIIVREQVTASTDLEKAETERDFVTTGSPSRPTTLQKGRTRSSRRVKEEPHPPASFWHWKMAGVRLHVLKLWFRTNLILAIAIFTFLCLFWGALFEQQTQLHTLKIWVVDFDSQGSARSNIEPFVGQFVLRKVHEILDSGASHPGYTIRSPSDFDDDPLKVRRSVYDFHAWAAVIVNANATTTISNAVKNGDEDYDPLGACQIIYNTARDQTTTASYINPSLTILQKTVVSTFGREWLSHLLSSTAPADLNLDTAPQAITPGIEFTMYDLRPFGPAIATPAVSIGLIYLIILSFFSFTFFLPIHMKYLNPRGHPPLQFTHLIVWRYVATVSSYFFLSLVYSLVSLAFLMPMTRPSASPTEPASNPNAYGRGTFPVYWMINWMGMTALGLASENMAMLLGTPWTALWLIFWVISNVATGFYSLELANGFYRWGYAWPIHNVAELTRQVLFDLHPRTSLNFGILLAWVAIGTALFPVCCYYMRWNTARTKKNAVKQEQAWKEKMEREREDPSLLARVTTRGSRRRV